MDRFPLRSGKAGRGARTLAEFEWDPAKEEKNIKERDLDFTTASRIWDGRVLEQIDDRRDYRETRILAFGKVDGR